MHKPASGVSVIIDKLQSFYGNQEPCWPTEPYDFLIWWHCGYPATDTNCKKGWEALEVQVGTDPRRILEAGAAKLEGALKHGGMLPEIRAVRLLEIAARVQDRFG